jgi:hypothetical protein
LTQAVLCYVASEQAGPSDKALNLIVSGNTVTNLVDGVTGASIVVYYNASDKDDNYLAGGTFNLSGGGILTPYKPGGAAPIPASGILPGSGLLGLIGFSTIGRRRRN